MVTAGVILILGGLWSWSETLRAIKKDMHVRMYFEACISGVLVGLGVLCIILAASGWKP